MVCSPQAYRPQISWNLKVDNALTYLTTNQSRECPQADHSLLIIPSRWRHNFEGISPLWPPLPGKAIKLFFPSAAAAKSLQSCPTLCDPIDRSPPGSPVPGILQARTLEWVAISCSNVCK